MKLKLDKNQQKILDKIVKKYAPNLDYCFLFQGDISDKDSPLINQLCEIINNEFLQEGLMEDFEPNQYGIELEDLLDKVNKINLLK